MELKHHIRDIPDFPQPGILFRDITPLLHNPDAFGEAMNQLAEASARLDFDAVAGIEARGFLFAAPLAVSLGKPLIPIRKEGKLPGTTHATTYELEYGQSVVEVHSDAIASGHRVLVIDDLLATGGTMSASTHLVERSGGEVAGVAVLIELQELGGRQALEGYDVVSLIQY